MSRYVTRPVQRLGSPTIKPRADWLDDEAPMLPSLTVDDHENIETGLFDASGDMIFRLPNPMGFGRDGEW